MNKTAWVCGKNIHESSHGIVWELQGVFMTEESAKKACRDEKYFIGPIEVDTPVSNETISWDGCYYPHLGMGSHGSQ